MITDSEKKALQLAKKVFEHFTHDALPIAREILAMEQEFTVRPVVVHKMNGLVSPLNEVKKADDLAVSRLLNEFPTSDMSIIGIDDPAQPVKQLDQELVYQSHDDFPF